MSRKLAHGVGNSDDGEFSRTYVDSNGKRKNTAEYTTWWDMLKRCYSPRYLDRASTYRGCQVSSDFHSFQRFAKWANGQVGFKTVGRHLDKDLLGDGKLYSKDNCVFLPAIVNKVMVNSRSTRGQYPVGVHWCNTKRKFTANCSNGNSTSKHIGYFPTATDAFLAYKKFKEAYIKQLAEQYRQEIDTRAYEALMNYKITMED